MPARVGAEALYSQAIPQRGESFLEGLEKQAMMDIEGVALGHWRRCREQLHFIALAGADFAKPEHCLVDVELAFVRRAVKLNLGDGARLAALAGRVGLFAASLGIRFQASIPFGLRYRACDLMQRRRRDLDQHLADVETAYAWSYTDPEEAIQGAVAFRPSLSSQRNLEVVDDVTEGQRLPLESLCVGHEIRHDPVSMRHEFIVTAKKSFFGPPPSGIARSS